MSGSADRGCARVIGDGHVLVVRQQRIIGPQHPACVGGVVDAGEEIGEIADPRWQVQVAVGGIVQQRRTHALDLAPLRPIRIQQVGQACAQGRRAAPHPARRSALSSGPAAASAARCASPVNSPASHPALRSKISSPMATPPRGASPRGLNTQNGRFWIGKSGWPLALSTRLLRRASCVALIVIRALSQRTARRILFPAATG